MKKNRCIFLFLMAISSFALAEPEVLYEKSMVKKMKNQPCTGERLPLTEEVQVKEAIECDYPKMKVIKIVYDDKDKDTIKVKLYAKGKIEHIIVNFPSGLTIDPEEK